MVTFQQMAGFLLFVAIGIVLGKLKALPDDAGMTLSKLVTYIFLPAMTFLSFAQQFTVDKLESYVMLLIAGTIVMAVGIALSFGMERCMPGLRLERVTAAYSMVVPNYGYLGYPLVLALFGQEVLSRFMIMVLPFNFYIYAYAITKWMPEDAQRGNWLKRICNPPMIGMLAGIAVGLSGITCPVVITQISEMASNCMGPCAMLVTGLVLGKISLKAAFCEKRAYWICLIRLLVLPTLFIGIIFGASRLLHWDREFLQMIGVYAALPLGLNPVVFAETYHQDSRFGAECALLSMLFGLITIPMILSILTNLSSLL